MNFHKDILKIDCNKEVTRISNFIQKQTHSMKREGAVIGISGGIDSSLCAELCVQALGKEKVMGLVLPERESNPVSEDYALKQAQKLGIETVTIDISSILDTFGTYRKRDEAIKEVFPEYDSHYKFKITLPPDLLSRDAFNFYTLTVDDGRGNVKSTRLKKTMLNAIISATNTKQRTRMTNLYYFAEKMNYLVCGTTNKSEVIQGFFVKYGDGGVDIELIAHLYKTQVYQLAEHIGVIEGIRRRSPSPDTFSFPVSDEEFFYRIPYHELDLLLFAWENRIPISKVCEVMELTEDQAMRAFRDFTAKHKATVHLRKLPPSILNQKES